MVGTDTPGEPNKKTVTAGTVFWFYNSRLCAGKADSDSGTGGSSQEGGGKLAGNAPRYAEKRGEKNHNIFFSLFWPFWSSNLLTVEYHPVLRIGIRYLVPFWPPRPGFRDSGSGMGNKSRSGHGIRDEHPGSYFRELGKRIFWVKNTKILWCGARSGIRILFTQDPVWKNSEPG